MKVHSHRSIVCLRAFVRLWVAAFLLPACGGNAPSKPSLTPLDPAPKGTESAPAPAATTPPPSGDQTLANSKVKSGLYGLKGPRDSVDPHLAGVLRGTSVGEAHGGGGLGLVGTGKGGGGSGYGTIGIGNIGTIGHGSGTGSGYGRGSYGSASGALMGASLSGIRLADEGGNTDAYAHQAENDFRSVQVAPLSTFSVDVDTASYSNVRSFIAEHTLPPVDAVRVEELINYFPYQYQAPHAVHPFAAKVEVASCPWQVPHRLVRIGIKARDINRAQRPASNLVFLIDVSGSMMPDNRLPLLKRGLRMLVESLDARDHVSMVVYAGSSGMVLPPTSGDQHATILAALDKLEAGGSTNGAAGIRLAYELASKQFITGGSNRVVLATDGDFNVGTTSEGELVRLIEKEAKSGVYLSVLGFGKGNLKDSTMEKLADRGNGNYAYVDTLQEARKVLVEQMTGTLITVAKDVKLQIEFNPNLVAAYRQIGYEDRQLRDEDFRYDKFDAGDIGAGHTVTALFEVVPVGVPNKLAVVDPLKYRAPAPLVAGTDPNELATVKIRYKPPAGDVSTVSSFTVKNDSRSWNQASVDYRFAAAVAEMGMLLRGSKNRAGATWASELALARSAVGEDRDGYRAEMIRLSEEASKLAPPTKHASR